MKKFGVFRQIGGIVLFGVWYVRTAVSMKKFGVLAFIGGIVLFGVFAVVGSYVSAYNYGNAAEKTITAQYDDLKNILGQYSLKVTEAAQVPTAYKDDLKEVVTAAISGRYGPNGSQATWQWIKEQNLSVDPSLYTKIQQIIEAGRDKFENAQTRFIDTKRGYETNLGYLWTGAWLKIAGYPKIDLAVYKIIQSQHGIDSFETGVDKGLQIR